MDKTFVRFGFAGGVFIVLGTEEEYNEIREELGDVPLRLISLVDHPEDFDEDPSSKPEPYKGLIHSIRYAEAASIGTAATGNLIVGIASLIPEFHGLKYIFSAWDPFVVGGTLLITAALHWILAYLSYQMYLYYETRGRSPPKILSPFLRKSPPTPWTFLVPAFVYSIYLVFYPVILVNPNVLSLLLVAHFSFDVLVMWQAVKRRNGVAMAQLRLLILTILSYAVLISSWQTVPFIWIPVLYGFYFMVFSDGSSPLIIISGWLERFSYKTAVALTPPFFQSNFQFPIGFRVIQTTNGGLIPVGLEWTGLAVYSQGGDRKQGEQPEGWDEIEELTGVAGDTSKALGFTEVYTRLGQSDQDLLKRLGKIVQTSGYVSIQTFREENREALTRIRSALKESLVDGQDLTLVLEAVDWVFFSPDEDSPLAQTDAAAEATLEDVRSLLRSDASRTFLTRMVQASAAGASEISLLFREIKKNKKDRAALRSCCMILDGLMRTRMVAPPPTRYDF